MMIRSLLIFVLIYGRVLCQDITLSHDKVKDNSVIGTFISVDFYAGSKFELLENNRFKAWWWTDVGGYHDQPSTVGRYDIVNECGILQFYSDRIPKKNVVKRDSTIHGFIIKAISENKDLIEYSEATVIYQDSTVEYPFDSTGIIFLKNIPKKVSVGGLGIFRAEHFITDYYTENELKLEINDFKNKELESYKPQEYDVLEIFLEEEYPYLNGDLYLMFGDRLYPMGNGLEKVSPK